MKQNKKITSHRSTRKNIKANYFWKKIVGGLCLFSILVPGAFLFSLSNNAFLNTTAETAINAPISYTEIDLAVEKKPTKLEFDWETGESTNQYQISISTATDTEKTRHTVRARSAVKRKRVESSAIDYRHYNKTDSYGRVSTRVKVVIKDLDPTTRYEFTISERSSLKTEYREIKRGEAFTTPRPPKNLQMDTGTTDNRFFELSWDVKDEKSQNIIAYIVYFREDRPENDPVTNLYDLSGWNRLSFRTPLARMKRFFELGKRYEFIVRAVGPDGNQSPIRKKTSFQSSLPEMKILIIDEGDHGVSVRRVLDGDLRPFQLTDLDFQEENRDIASSQNPTYLGTVSTTGDTINEKKEWVVDTPLDETFDIVNLSFVTPSYSTAQKFYRKLKEKYGHLKTKPIFVLSGGNERTACTDAAYKYAKEHGTLPYKNPGYRYRSAAEQQAIHYRACNLLPAYIAREHPEFMENVIVVGGNAVSPRIFIPGFQHPGSVLKDHWISTYYGFSPRRERENSRSETIARPRYGVSQSVIYGTSFSAPYVARALANIKSRLPYLSNAQILDIVYDTALPHADREVWGRGVFNPGNIDRRINEIQEQNRAWIRF